MNPHVVIAGSAMHCGLEIIIIAPDLQDFIRMSHFIARKNYDERITTIHMGKVYDDTFRKLIQQQVQKNKRILLVDDEYDVNLAIRLILEENGFKVDSFTDSSRALENFIAGLYDLVLLDVKLPGMDGFRLYEKIKKLDDKVRICFLTATDRSYYETLKKHYPSINENCVIYKPVDNESLLRLINCIL
jgi:CheY-like chemotaxis protein